MNTAVASNGTATSSPWYSRFGMWVVRSAVAVPGWGATRIFGTMNVIASLFLSAWALKYFYGFKFVALLKPIGLGLGEAVDTALLDSSPAVRWIAIGYLLVQGTSLVLMNIQNVGILAMDFLTSLLPGGVIGFAFVDRVFGPHYTMMSAGRADDLLFMLGVVAIDVGVFGVLGLKLNRRYLGDTMGAMPIGR